MKSPIKYYGGKTYMVPYIKEHIPQDYSTYIEGFGGGASLLFSLDPQPIEIYNDIDANVYSLFKVIQDEVLFSRFSKRLELTPYSSRLWTEFKEDLKKELPIEERAYKYFYVNRTSFNGNGGFSRNSCIRRKMSKFISDYLASVERLSEVHERISKTIILNYDIFKLIDLYDQEDVFLYLDPPYIPETRVAKKAYLHEMSFEDHERLINRIKDFKGKCLVSGYDHSLYDKLSWNKYSFKSPHSKKQECLWRNY